MKKAVEVRSQNKQETMIALVKSAQHSDCITDCMIECRCFIAVFFGQVCQLFSIAAKDFLVENPDNVELFYYKINMLDGAPITTMNGKIKASLIKIDKNRGPKTDTCGTPREIGHESESL